MNKNGENQKKIMDRLARLEGQIGGVRRMIASGEDCEKIVTQLSAAHSALEGVTKLVVAGYFRECLAESGPDPESNARTMERFVTLLLRTRM